MIYYALYWLMPMLSIHEKSGYVEFEVLARPKAGKNAVGGVRDGALLVSVTAPPDKGKANEAIIGILAKSLRIGKSCISIVRGETSKRKVLRIDGVSKSDIESLAGEVSG